MPFTDYRNSESVELERLRQVEERLGLPCYCIVWERAGVDWKGEHYRCGDRLIVPADEVATLPGVSARRAAVPSDYKEIDWRGEREESRQLHAREAAREAEERARAERRQAEDNARFEAQNAKTLEHNREAREKFAEERGAIDAEARRQDAATAQREAMARKGLVEVRAPVVVPSPK